MPSHDVLVLNGDAVEQVQIAALPPNNKVEVAGRQYQLTSCYGRSGDGRELPLAVPAANPSNVRHGRLIQILQIWVAPISLAVIGYIVSQQLASTAQQRQVTEQSAKDFDALLELGAEMAVQRSELSVACYSQRGTTYVACWNNIQNTIIKLDAAVTKFSWAFNRLPIRGTAYKACAAAQSAWWKNRQTILESLWASMPGCYDSRDSECKAGRTQVHLAVRQLDDAFRVALTELVRDTTEIRLELVDAYFPGSKIAKLYREASDARRAWLAEQAALPSQLRTQREAGPAAQ